MIIAMTQCHSGGIALQSQNWLQKFSICFLPSFIRLHRNKRARMG
jgi:hypothetical protein